METIMKLTAAQIKQTATALQATAVPDRGSLVPELKGLFGEHTFFLGNEGLLILQPEPVEGDAVTGRVVKMAAWSNSEKTGLSVHPPQPLDQLIELDEAA